MTTFIARVAAGFEHLPFAERLYEVVTRDGERIASCTSVRQMNELAHNLNVTVASWAATVGVDAVID